MVRAPGDPAGEVRKRGSLLPLRSVVALLGICLLVLAAVVWALFGRAPQTVAGKGILLPSGGYTELGTEIVGAVDSVNVSPGFVVRADTTVATVTEDASGDRHAIKTPVDGVIVDVSARPGRRTLSGEPLALLDPLESDLVVTAFLPAGPAATVTPGMPALVSPSGSPPAQYGYVEGTVASVSPAPVALTRVLTLVGNNEQLGEYFVAGEPVTEVTITMTPGDTPSGVTWTIGTGPDDPLDGGTLSAVRVVTHDGTVIDWMKP